MEYKEEDYLQLSGLQHFIFCRRQWALIHIEGQWAENFLTVDGELLHEKAHDAGLRESRGDRIIIRGMPIRSARLGVSGQCDVVELHQSSNGVQLPNLQGSWQPYPVEYKRGKPKEDSADILQLCGQALCLEEMLCCTVPEGALYYGETRHRTSVPFTSELRSQVEDALAEMHQLYRRGYTPKVKPRKGCSSCSLKNICLPKMLRTKSVSAYLAERMEGLP